MGHTDFPFSPAYREKKIVQDFGQALSIRSNTIDIPLISEAARVQSLKWRDRLIGLGKEAKSALHLII